MQRRVRVLLLLAACTAGLVACGDTPSDTPTRARRATPHVYTTFYPTTYFAARIVGAHGRVFCPLPGDADPAHWKPTTGALAAYQDDADLIFVNGAGLEAWVAKAGLPRGRLFDTARGFEREWITFDGAVKHTHGGEEHAHHGTDPHTWMDPVLAIRQARVIDARLREQWPEHDQAYQRGTALLLEDLQALHQTFAKLKQPEDGTWIHAAQPVYDYLARRYGWRIHGLDLDPDSVPTEGEFSFLTSELEQKPATYLWWPRAPKAEVAEAIRKRTGLESVVFSTCVHPPTDTDYLGEMRANARRIRPAFKE